MAESLNYTLTEGNNGRNGSVRPQTFKFYRITMVLHGFMSCSISWRSVGGTRGVGMGGRGAGGTGGQGKTTFDLIRFVLLLI